MGGGGWGVGTGTERSPVFLRLRAQSVSVVRSAGDS